MKVSILIPIYGVENYIEACAHSLFKQSYHDLEYIFVDDCSPDHSIERLERVIKQYPERQTNIRIFHHKENKGLGAARLTATQYASGEAIMHVDSDDLLPKDAVKFLVKTMEESGADIVSGAYADYQKKQWSKPHYPQNLPKETYLWRILCQNIVKNNIWARIYKRAFLDEYQVFATEGIDYAEDYSYIARAFLHAKHAVTNKLVYGYRIDNGSSYTHNVSKKNLISMIKANQMVFTFYTDLKTENPYCLALDMGLLNMVRNALKHGMSYQEIATYCDRRPQQGFTKLLFKLLLCPLSRSFANRLYRLSRRLMLFCHVDEQK